MRKSRSSAVARVTAIAEIVRHASERLARNATLANWCMPASAAIVALATERGIRATVIGGLYLERIGRLRFGDAESIRLRDVYRYEHVSHCWVRVGRADIDVTLTQFEPAAVPVSVFPSGYGRLRGVPFRREAVEFSLDVYGSRKKYDRILARVRHAMEEHAHA